MKSRLLGLLTVGLLAWSAAANAATVTYDFTVNAGGSGPLAGQTASGFFSYSDSIIPGGGGVVQQTGLLTALDFTWNGINYNEATANTGWLGFDSGGALTNWGFGNSCGIGSCGVLFGTDQWNIYNATGFAYGLSGISGAFYGTSSLRLRGAPVPEPGTLALLGLGLASLGLSRRRKAD